MKFLLKYAKPYRGRIIAGLLIKFAGTYMDLLIPMLLAHIIDYVVPLKAPKLILLWGFYMLAAAVAAVTLNIIANRMAVKNSKNITGQIREDCYKKVMSLSCTQLDKVTIPSAISRLTSDTYEIHIFLSMAQRIGVRAPFLLVVGVIMSFAIDWRMALVLSSVLPVLAIIIKILYSHGMPLYKKSRIAGDDMVRSVRENISGARIIKALSKKDYEDEKFSSINEDVKYKNKKAEGMMAVTGPAMSWFLNIGMGMVLLSGAFLVSEGLTSKGSIIAFLSYCTIILSALMTVTRIFVMISRTSASCERIVEILDMPKDIMKTEEKEEEEKSPCAVEFKNVTFSYNKKKPNLDNISFKLEKGQTMGIIGETGSGKSTLICLLLRFYDPDEGEIFVDGRNIKTYDPKELRQKFGTVFQNDILFADSIKNNIAFGRKCSEENIEEAVSYAEAKEFINNLPDNVEHQLSIKGNNLSGGQKQRVLISRALAGNPHILLLDDSSSALDYKTDASVRRAISQNYKDTTKIIITQRITSIMHSDLILVLENAKTVGMGKHEELLKSCGVYKEIYDVQAGKEESL